VCCPEIHSLVILIITFNFCAFVVGPCHYQTKSQIG